MPGDDQGTTLRFEFYKNIAALSLAALGGEITLLNTIFARVADKSLAYASYVCLFFATLSAYGAQEALLNRLWPPPAFRSRLADRVLTPRLRSVESQYVLEAVSAVLLALGIALFAWFAVVGPQGRQLPSPPSDKVGAAAQDKDARTSLVTSFR